MGHNNQVDAHDLAVLMGQVQKIARAAGAELMTHYDRHNANDGALKIEIKDDDSPVTEADQAAHKLITEALATLTPRIPIISEENAEHPDIPQDGRFWTVDPLDGTKGFIQKTGGFYVKIALMDGFKPILGVIFQPVTGDMFHAVRDGHSYHQDKDGGDHVLARRKVTQTGQEPLSTTFNKLHHDPEAYEKARDYLNKAGLNIPEKSQAREKVSTVFNMAVAKGEVDAYLDCGGKKDLIDGNGFSWDYAPDWLILKNIGGVMIEILTGEEINFREPTTRMNAMINLADRELGKKYFPKLENDCV